jgi:DNA invertase Pin-like site-specific DNA recombinase
VWRAYNGRATGASASRKAIAKAKAAGVYKGRPAPIDGARVRELKAQGVDIAKALGIGHTSAYRAL